MNKFPKHRYKSNVNKRSRQSDSRIFSKQAPGQGWGRSEDLALQEASSMNCGQPQGQALLVMWNFAKFCVQALYYSTFEEKHTDLYVKLVY